MIKYIVIGLIIIASFFCWCTCKVNGRASREEEEAEMMRLLKGDNK